MVLIHPLYTSLMLQTLHQNSILIPWVIHRRDVAHVRAFCRRACLVLLLPSVQCVRRKQSSVTLGNNFQIVQPQKGTGHCARSVALRETCRNRNCSLSLVGPKAELMPSHKPSWVPPVCFQMALMHSDFFFFEDPKEDQGGCEEDYIRLEVTCSYRVIWLYRVRMWP